MKKAYAMDSLGLFKTKSRYHNCSEQLQSYRFLSFFSSSNETNNSNKTWLSTLRNTLTKWQTRMTSPENNFKFSRGMQQLVSREHDALRKVKKSLIYY
jgi:hypothetical protein